MIEYLEQDLALSGMLEQVRSRFGSHDGHLSGFDLVKIESPRKTLRDSARLRRLAGIRNRNASSDTVQIFHLVIVILVPSPGRLSISNSLLNRLAPPSPNPMPLAVV